MKKISKNFLVVALSAFMLAALPLSVNAKSIHLSAEAQATVSDVSTVEDSSNNEVHQLVTTPPSTGTSGGVTPYGTNPPSGTAWDLSLNSYHYQVQSMGYQLYTDTLLKGATKMRVSIEGWTKLEGSSPSQTLAVSLYTSGGSYVTGLTLDMADYGSAAFVYFSNISSTTNYYVKFQVPTNGNIWSFSGTISKVE